MKRIAVVCILQLAVISGFAQSNLTLTGVSNGAASIDLKNGAINGYWHFSAPRSFEPDNPLTLSWNDGTSFTRYLTVSDDGDFNYERNIVFGGDNKTFMIHHQYWNPNSDGLIFAPYNSGALDWTKSMVFRKSGNLEVKGTIYAHELKVQLSPFPDYVFADDYTLLSLGQLERFIAANGHLPNIPSAKEVEKGELGLGELQRLQMEKIEELTLYILELKKELTALQEEVEALTGN